MSICPVCHVFSLTVGFYFIGLIAFRIWWSQRQNRETKLNSNLSHVTIIMIESGKVLRYSEAIADT